MSRRLLALTVGVVVALTACGVDDAPTGTPEPAPEPVPVPDDDGEEPLPPPDEDVPVEALEDAVALAVGDAAEQAGVATGDVEVVTAEEVTWPDGALGCPQPDRMYTQALVDGYRIVLDVAGVQVHYHGADGQAPFRCDQPTAPVGRGQS